MSHLNLLLFEYNGDPEVSKDSLLYKCRFFVHSSMGVN